MTNLRQVDNLSKTFSSGPLLALLSAILLLAGGLAQADWAGLARFQEIAELAIEPDGMHMNLRIAAKSLPADAGLGGGTAWLAAHLPQLADGQGKALVGKLQSLRKADAPDQQAYYEAELDYAADTGLRALSITPPTGPTAAGLVVLHRGVPVSDLSPLQKTLKLALDWDDPWRSHFDDPALIRRHAEPRSYVYVEPYEVRHELLLRLKDLSRLDLGLRDAHHVEDGERDALKRNIGAFLLGRNPLRIDGTEATPQLDRVEFVRFSRSGVSPITEPGRLDADTLLVGVVLAYLTESPARTISLRWDLFGRADGQRQVSLIQGVETFDAYMTAKQPGFDWAREDSFDPPPPAELTDEPVPTPRLDAAMPEPTGFRTFAVTSLVLALATLLFTPRLLQHRAVAAALGLSLVLAAGASFHPRPTVLAGTVATGLDEAQAKRLLQALLHNAYRAFQLRDEAQAYDRLAKSLDGDLLEEIYLQQRRALLRQAEGMGGEGKVDRIDVLDSQVSRLEQTPAAWQVSSRWMAHGTVSHWGHSHDRQNLYQARLTLRPAQDGQWRIVGLEFVGGQRLAPGSSS